MVQELHVLKCFSCETFQSHIVKKTNKWECKVCGVKQSIKKVYGRGSGKDCRLHTQKLNALKGEKEEINPELEIEEFIAEDLNIKQTSSFTKAKPSSPRVSKWSEYVNEEKINIESKNYFGEERLGYSCETEHDHSDTRLTAKRKFHETDFVDEEPNINTYGSIINKYSTSLCQSSFGTYGSKKKIKGGIQLTGSYTEDNNFVEQDLYGEFSEDDSAEKNKPLSLKPAKKINTVDVNSKWAKYLEEEEQDEEDHSLKS